MASPQIENGFTRIANELAEALSRINLSAYESRVIWFLVRNTYGRGGKKNDQIALSQIAEATSLDRGNAGRALRSLKDRGIVVIEAERIGIQKDYEQWRAVSIKTPPVSVETLCLLRPQNGVCRDTKMVSVETLLKKEEKIKDSVKGKPSRPKADSRVKELIDWFAAEYTKRFEQPYHVRGGKDGQLVKDLLRTFDLPELKNRALRLWESEDPFISRTDRGIGILASQINKLVPLPQPSQPPLTNTPKGDLTYAHG